jgi:hypothetical protein
MVEMKERGPKLKGTIKQGWCARDCMKNTLRSSIFKKLLYVYNLNPLNFFLKNQFWYTSLFLLFFNHWLEKWER